MRNLIRKVAYALVICVTVLAVMYSCKKSPVPPDPNLEVPVTRQLVISALNAFTTDSIGQFSISVTTPTTPVNQVTTGNTYVITNIVTGTYVITISKTGYVTSNPSTVNVVVPSDPKASMIIKESVGLTKAAPAVVVTGTAGGVVTTKSNPDVASSQVVANTVVAPATVFTLADGTKPATVSISVSSVPINTQLVPVMNVGGVNEVQVSGIDVIKDQIPVKTLDLQPEGMTFDKPMIIDMYIGDMYPPNMSINDKTAKQNGLTLNYVRKDGTVEVLTPDHFSADRNTVFYKVTHFSKWNLLDNWVSIKLISTTKSPLQTKTSSCNFGLAGNFSYTSRYVFGAAADPYGPWLLTSRFADAVYTVAESFSFPVQSGYYVQATWQCTLENWQMTDNCPGAYWQQWHIRNFVIPVQGDKVKLTYVVCHNQGG
jgi:hypothetical protein